MKLRNIFICVFVIIVLCGIGYYIFIFDSTPQVSTIRLIPSQMEDYDRYAGLKSYFKSCANIVVLEEALKVQNMKEKICKHCFFYKNSTNMCCHDVLDTEEKREETDTCFGFKKGE